MNRVLVIGLLAIAPTCAFAIDGQVLINQSTVISAGGFPYLISNPGSYKLTGNLSATAGKPAIQITASNVTLDLNGFNVASLGPTSGPFSDTATGIAITGVVSNIKIRNGTMFGWSPAVGMFQGSLLSIEDMSFEENFTLPGGLTIGNGVAVEAFNGVKSLLTRVITDGQLLVSCPSVITNSVANFIKGFGGVCVFANTVGN